MSNDTAVQGRMRKLPPIINEQGEVVYNKHWSVECTWNSTKEHVFFNQLWRKDVRVKCYHPDYCHEHCAQGSVIKVVLRAGDVYRITVSLEEVERREGNDGWDKITGLGDDTVLKVVSHVTRLEKRGKLWHEHRPSTLARQDTSQGKILATLLGIHHDDPLSLLDVNNKIIVDDTQC